MKIMNIVELNEFIREKLNVLNLSDEEKKLVIDICDEVYNTAWRSGYNEHRILTILDKD